MKIALVGTTAACVLGFRASLIRALVSQGHDVYAFALDYCPVTRDKIYSLGATPVDYTFNRAGLNPMSDIVNTFRLFRIVKRLEPELVFSYFAKPVIFATLASRLAGVRRCVGMLEGLGYIFTDQPHGLTLKLKVLRFIQSHLYRLAFPHLERLVFLNPDDPKDLLDKYRLRVKNVTVLGGIGLDLDYYPFSVPVLSPISFIFVGRLLAEKGIHQYVAAARSVKAKYPDVSFTLLGGVDEDNPGGLKQAELDSLISADIVTHVGWVENVSEWLARSSVFVLPSYREGLPRSTQEAMAMGRPVITTDVPGCRDTVEHGRNGFLIEPWSATALAEKMIYFIEHPEAIEVMGLESYTIAQERYDATKVNAQLMEYFS
jgi:glycosyltransferase involved in cell wall biosynthesis